MDLDEFLRALGEARILPPVPVIINFPVLVKIPGYGQWPINQISINWTARTVELTNAKPSGNPIVTQNKNTK